MTHSQTKLDSILEQVLNIGSGFIIALLIWRFVVTPYLDIPVSYADNLVITGTFTVVSLVRGYVWRRTMNKWHGYKIQKRIRNS